MPLVVTHSPSQTCRNGPKRCASCGCWLGWVLGEGRCVWGVECWAWGVGCGVLHECMRVSSGKRASKTLRSDFQLSDLVSFGSQ